jgi:hypothetical protein
MLEEDKECTNCTFDTMAIVTVEIDNWEYCPVCGSDLRSASDEDEEETDDMKEIPINTPEEPDSQSNDSQETQDKDTEEDNKTDRNEEAGNQEEQVDEFVEEELKRLRDNTENEEKKE